MIILPPIFTTIIGFIVCVISIVVACSIGPIDFSDPDQRTNIALLVGFTFSVLWFLSHVTYLRERRRNKHNLNDLDRMFKEFREEVRQQERMFENLLNLVNETFGLSMWVKDKDDRFLFLNKSCKNLLFASYDYDQIIGKSDQEILCPDEQCDYVQIEELFKNMDPEDFPNIDYSHFADKLVCNITDVVTRALNKPCRFYEELGCLSLDVWKNPITSDSGEVIGTVGCLVDITKQRHKWLEGIHHAEKSGKAYRINSTRQFYITDYDFNSHILSDKLEDTIYQCKRENQIMYERERHFYALINSIEGVSIQGYDSDRRVVFWTSGSEQLYGYKEEEALGKKLEDLIIPKNMQKEVINAHYRWLEYGEPIASEPLDLVDKYGNTVTVLSMHMLHNGPRGKEMYCVDIDERLLKGVECNGD